MKNKLNQICLIFFFALLLASCAGAGLTPAASAVPDPGPTSIAPQPEKSQPVNSTGVIRFSVLSLEEGLSQSVVNCILQDRLGFLWLGTQDGLNRYDGYNFKIYKPDPNDPNSISDGWINALYEDKNGFLWIGTAQGGLNKYDPLTGKFTRFQHNPKDDASLSIGEINAILEDNSGKLWVGTDTGLNRFDPTDGTFTRFQNNPDDPGSLSDNHVDAIFQDKQG
ncbi:MAG: two-component regulator propeller domain-containing protein, partial [Chloroflexota bacterium]